MELESNCASSNTIKYATIVITCTVLHNTKLNDSMVTVTMMGFFSLNTPPTLFDVKNLIQSAMNRMVFINYLYRIIQSRTKRFYGNSNNEIIFPKHTAYII